MLRPPREHRATPGSQAPTHLRALGPTSDAEGLGSPTSVLAGQWAVTQYDLTLTLSSTPALPLYSTPLRVLKSPGTDQADAASFEKGKLRPKVTWCARHSTEPWKSRFSLCPSLTSSTTRPSGCPSAPTSKYTSGFREEEFAPRAPPSLQVRVAERSNGAERGPESRPSRRGPQRSASIAVAGRARARGRTLSRYSQGRTTQEAKPRPRAAAFIGRLTSRPRPHTPPPRPLRTCLLASSAGCSWQRNHFVRCAPPHPRTLSRKSFESASRPRETLTLRVRKTWQGVCVCVGGACGESEVDQKGGDNRKEKRRYIPRHPQGDLRPPAPGLSLSPFASRDQSVRQKD